MQRTTPTSGPRVTLAPSDRPLHELTTALRPGCLVTYVGVINNEADLEKEGVVKGGPNENGDILVEWTVLGEREQRWELPSTLEALEYPPYDVGGPPTFFTPSPDLSQGRG